MSGCKAVVEKFQAVARQVAALQERLAPGQPLESLEVASLLSNLQPAVDLEDEACYPLDWEAPSSNAAQPSLRLEETRF